MGKRGPKAKPAAIKIANGTYRKDRDGGLDLPADTPDMPDWIDERVADIWEALVLELSKTNGLLASIDKFAMGRYCENWLMYQDAKALIESGGIVAYTDSGNVYQHPAVGIKNKADERLCRFEAKYGMTPSDRVGLKFDKPKQGVRRRQA